MFKIRGNLAVAVMTSLFFCEVTAAFIKTEFHPAKDQCAEYQEKNYGGDCTIITLEEWPAHSSIDVSETWMMLSENKSKKLPSITLTDNVPAYSLLVSSTGYVPGVPVKYIFRDVKNNLKKHITIIPNRIYAKSAMDDAEIEAILTIEYPVNYKIEFNGFRANEKLILESTSYDERLNHKFEMNKKGEISMMPGVLGKEGGIAQVNFKRPSGEVLKLELPWGMEWMKYFLICDQNNQPISIIDTPEFAKENPTAAKYFSSSRQ